MWNKLNDKERKFYLHNNYEKLKSDYEIWISLLCTPLKNFQFVVQSEYLEFPFEANTCMYMPTCESHKITFIKIAFDAFVLDMSKVGRLSWQQKHLNRR